MEDRITPPSLNDVLDMVSSAEHYAYDSPIVMSFLSDLIGRKLSGEEIERFCQWLYEGNDYTEEDYQQVKEKLTEFKDRYINK